MAYCCRQEGVLNMRVPCMLQYLVLIGFAALFRHCDAKYHCADYQQSIVPLPEASGCTRPSQLTDDGACTDEHHTCKSRPGAIAWTLVNNVTGQLDVTFLLPSAACRHTNYTIELRVRGSGLDEDTCTDAIKDQEFDLTHSWRRFAVADESASSSMEVESRSPCQQTGRVSFQYVFTGCYQVVINPYIGSNTRRAIHSCSLWIATDYKKRRINEEVPTFTTQYRYQDRDSPVTVTFPPLMCNHLHMEIKLMANVSVGATSSGAASGGTSGQDSGEASVEALGADGWADCYRAGSVHSSCVLGSNKAAKCEKVYCTVEADQVSCVFSDVLPGSYCVRLRLFDDRCETDTLWTTDSDGGRRCSWHSAFNATADASTIDTQIASPGDPSPSFVIAGAVLVVLLVLAIATVVFTIKYYLRRKTKQRLTVLPVSQSADSVSPIVLLYARDCQPFMTLMTSFRVLLEDMTMCEVYDVFDTNRWAEQSRNPVEWIRRLVCHRDAKIIVVATKCALMRQQSHQDGTTVLYKTPASTDDLFLYALQALTDKLSSDVYQRLFVVRFEGFSEDADLLLHLNSYTRFVLPSHLERLLHNLQSSFTDHGSHLMDTEEVQNICQDLTNLINYKNQNANYLRNLLRIQRSS